MIMIPQLFTLTLLTLSAFVSQSPAAAASPSNVPQLVNLRVEGLDSTLFQGRVWSRGHDVTTLSSGGSHPCQGKDPNDPGATATSVLDDAGKKAHFTFDGTWSGGDIGDLFITSIAGLEQTDSKWWGLIINYVFASTGGCGSRVNTGDTVLWLYDAFTEKSSSLLKLDFAEPEVSTTESKQGATQCSDPWVECKVQKGQTVKFFVGDGASGAPKAGAVLTGGVETDENGFASIVFENQGAYRVQAEREDSVRSNAIDIRVV